jgi:hypothetical protein
VRVSGQADELIGRLDEIFRSHGGVLAERHIILAPDIEGRNTNLAGRNVEIVVNGAVPIERRGKGSWLGKPQRGLVNEVFGTRGSNASRSLRAPSASKSDSGEPARSRKKRT